MGRLTHTVSGSVAAFQSADVMPMSVVAQVVPVQNLNGQSSPYPPGVGKNLCPIDTVNFTPITQWVSLSNTNASTITDGTKVYLSAGTYYIKLYNSSNVNSLQVFDSSENYLRNGTSGSFTISEAQYIYIRIKATSVTTALVFNIQIETGSSYTDWSPYSNICPITGWTGCNITQATGDLFDADSYEEIDLSGSGAIRYGHTFTETGAYTITNTTIYNKCYRIPKADLSDRGTTVYIASNTSVNVTVPTGYMLWVFDSAYSQSEFSKISVVKRTVYPITFPPSAGTSGTVYGGTVAVNADGTAELSMTHVKEDLDRTWSTLYTGTNHIAYRAYVTMYYYGYTTISPFITEKYPVAGNKSGDSSFSNPDSMDIGIYWQRNASYPDVRRMWLVCDINDTPSGKIVYKLLEPVSYTLSASALTTLLRHNSVWADTGDVSVEYQFADHLYRKRPTLLNPHKETVTGSIASFRTDMALPLDITAQIEPVQDLHGYANPWVGGAGKNLVPLVESKIKTLNTTGTWNGDVYTVSNVAFTLNKDADGNIVSVKVNGTANANISFRFNPTDSLLPLTSGTNISLTASDGVNGNNYKFQADIYADGTYKNSIQTGSSSDPTRQFSGTLTAGNIRIYVTSGSQLNNVVLYPQVEIASSATSYVPYENLCPISGHTGANIVRTGKNLAYTELTGYNVDQNAKVVANSSFSLHVARVAKGVEYVCSGNTDIANGYCLGFFYSEPTANAYTYNNTRLVTSNTRVFTAPITGYVAVRSYTTDTSVQIQLGATASSYESYNGTALAIPFGGYGKNLIPYVEPGLINTTTGEDGQTSPTANRSGYINVQGNTTYTFSGATGNVRFLQIDSTGVIKNEVISVTNSVQIVTLENARYVRFQADKSVVPTDASVQFEKGSSATSYEPYGTLYGGTIRVDTDGNGTVVVDRVRHRVGDIAWNYDSTYTRFYKQFSDMKQYGTRKQVIQSSAFLNPHNGEAVADVPDKSIYNGGTNLTIYIKDTEHSTAETFKQAYGDETFIVELASPLTYTLTASQVKALIGQNNVWCDTGNSTIKFWTH